MRRFEDLLKGLAETAEQEFNEISSRGGHRENISSSSEVVTEVDERMTEVITEAFNSRPETFTLESEELKKKGHREEQDADYTVIFDEIDGTGNMKNDRGPFGPIVGIAEGNDPEFRDVVSSMFYDLKNDVLYEAYADEGAFMDGEEVEASETVDYTEKSAVRGLVDQAMVAAKPELAEPLWRYHCKDFGSMGHNLVLVASDRADFFVTGGHGYVKDVNTAEEIAPLYLLLKEAGAAVTDWSGEDIGDRRIGMSQNRSHDIIAAATQKFAEKISEDIRKQY